MPIYEYQCQSCGHAFETMQRISEAPLTTCPRCEGPLKKLVSAPAFQFKGSGWYVTDYSRSGGGKESGGEKKTEAATTSESKPAESSAPKSDTPTAAKPPASTD